MEILHGPGFQTAKDNVWAVTTFFNPTSCTYRTTNFRRFRQELNVHLIAVELAFGGPFELDPGDAELLLRVRAGDVLWQKERLLNLAISVLPPSCDVVAWLDCDIIFDQSDWATLALDALERSNLVQLFEEVYDLPRDVHSLGDGGTKCEAARSAAASRWKGIDLSSSLLSPAHRSTRSFANGLAWAARRELIQQCGLYDTCILGSGDRAMLCAALGHSEWAIQALQMNTMQAAHFGRWGNTFFDLIQGRIGYVPGKLCHLWHGDPADRQLSTRYEILKPFTFNPAADIELSSDNCWVWSTPKKGMHRAVFGYFRSRSEDA